LTLASRRSYDDGTSKVLPKLSKRPVGSRAEKAARLPRANFFQETLKQAMSSINMSAPCFTKASSDLTAFMNTKPFQTGYLGTAAQQGAGSSAGLVANGKAAMELQGD
jgi:hypothetical protein